MQFGADQAWSLGWKTQWDPTMKRPEGEDVARTSVEALRAVEDRGLVAAFLAGQSEAFDVIVERHRRQVYQVCYRFVGNHEDAADLSQDVFIRAFRGLTRFKGDSSVNTWLYRIAVNACLNRVSSKRPDAEPIDAAELVDHRSIDPLMEVARQQASGSVRRAIRRLPPKQRATVVLRVYQELSHEEIARVLGSSVGAVKANFFHALGNLRRFMSS